MKSSVRRYCLVILGLSSIAFFSSQSLSQIAEDEATVTYPSSYFAEYGSVTAKDMLDRIPGVGSTTGGGSSSSGGFRGGGGGSGGRGFGSGSSSSEILINGKRTAGKNNQTSGILNRITADQVDYIQIIRGTSGELDVRGSGQVVNIVTFEEVSASSLQYQINADHQYDGHTQPGGDLSYSNRIGGLDLVLSAVAEPRYNHEESKEDSVLGDLSSNDRVIEERTTQQTSYEYTANLGYEFSDRTSARFNALYSQNDNPTKLERSTTDFTEQPNAIVNQFEDIPGNQDNWEIGGDFETFFNNGDRFKVLFVLNQDNRDSTRERFDLFNDGSSEKNLFLKSGSVTEEEIVRSSYTMDMFTAQDIEFGAERAVTTLDSNLALGLPTSNGTPSSAFGGLVPIPVSNANSTVEETRYEPFLIHNWVINPRMSLESHVLYEYSEIEQKGDVYNKRDFDFIKPKVDFRYDITPTLQLRGSVEKIVTQLRFSDFVAATDDQDEDSNTFAGNTNLRQEWFWKYDFNAEYRLPNDAGVVDANLFYHDHHDVIEKIDVSPSEDDLKSANGNIGDGKMYGLRVNASVRMQMIDMPNLLVSSAWSVQDSEIEDPFTGIDRRFAHYGRGRWTLSFRHDIPEWNMNWGGSWSNRFDGNEKIYDIDDVLDLRGDPSTSVFAEWISPNGTSWRFDARGLGSNNQCRERMRFVGRLSTGILEEIENRCSTRGWTTSLKITGTF
ncbi:MAG: TonB-dependent receptor plug domain-containing protein [Gammaproteobacteria bacterium]|jgi:outer membrane receptor for ferrienterochelin and colicins|nr:TonB-dependent receptor plug domain-containing protein [Gammaproteobacteria bacterium]